MQRTTQQERLIALLRAHKFKPVSLRDVQALGIAQHSPRFNELRRLGYVIKNDLDPPNADGVRHSWYTLWAEPGEPVPMFAVDQNAGDVTVSRYEAARQRGRRHRG